VTATADVLADDFDLLVIAGGYGADKLRVDGSV
jgi:putative intracellular protease/amidase